MQDYLHFLRVEKNISHNVARRYLEFVKTIIYPAVRTGAIKVDPFRELKFKAKPVVREFLSQDVAGVLKNGNIILFDFRYLKKYQYIS